MAANHDRGRPRRPVLDLGEEVELARRLARDEEAGAVAGQAPDPLYDRPPGRGERIDRRREVDGRSARPTLDLGHSRDAAHALQAVHERRQRHPARDGNHDRVQERLRELGVEQVLPAPGRVPRREHVGAGDVQRPREQRPRQDADHDQRHDDERPRPRHDGPRQPLPAVKTWGLAPFMQAREQGRALDPVAKQAQDRGQQGHRRQGRDGHDQRSAGGDRRQHPQPEHPHAREADQDGNAREGDRAARRLDGAHYRALDVAALGQLLAEPRHGEQGIVHPHPEAQHRGDIEHEDRQRFGLCQQEQEPERRQHRDPADHERDARGDRGAEREREHDQRRGHAQ